MRSSMGGWVSYIRFHLDSSPSSSVRANGHSIQRWAVARVPAWTTVEVSRSFSSAAIRPGG